MPVNHSKPSIDSPSGLNSVQPQELFVFIPHLVQPLKQCVLEKYIATDLTGTKLKLLNFVSSVQRVNQI